MYVACSTLCFSRLSLDRALRQMAEMEFSKVEVAIRDIGPHLTPAEVLADVGAAGQKIRIGPSLAPAAFHVDMRTPDEALYKQQFQAICHLARLSTVPLITMPAAAAGVGLDAEAKRLAQLTRITLNDGLILCVETRIGTVTEYPDAAAELCKRVPGLSITLDPSHYIAGPNQGKSYEVVYPYVKHMHLRDTGRGADQFQVRVGQGEVEYGRILSQLSRYSYSRVLTVDIHDIPDAPYAQEAEVRKLKYLLESLL